MEQIKTEMKENNDRYGGKRDREKREGERERGREREREKSKKSGDEMRKREMKRITCYEIRTTWASYLEP